VRPGYAEIRYVVTVISASSEEDVMRLLDTADRCSSYRDIFALTLIKIAVSFLAIRTLYDSLRK